MWKDYNSAVQHNDALEYLLAHYDTFPTIAEVLPSGATLSQALFRNWHWIITLDNELVFGNCIDPGITKDYFDQRQTQLLGCLLMLETYYPKQKE